MTADNMTVLDIEEDGKEIDFDTMAEDYDLGDGEPFTVKPSAKYDQELERLSGLGYDATEFSREDRNKFAVLVDKFHMTAEQAMKHIEAEWESDDGKDTIVEEDGDYTKLLDDDQLELLYEAQTDNPEVTAKHVYDVLKARNIPVKDDTETFYLSLMDKEDRKAYEALKSFDPEEWDAKQYYIYGIKGTRKEKAAHKQQIREYETKKKVRK